MLTGGLTDVREGVSREVWYESEAVRPRVPPGLLAGAVSRLLLFLVVEHLQLAVEIHVKELGGFWLHQIGLHWFTFHLKTVQSRVVVSGGQSYLALVRSEIKMVRRTVPDLQGSWSYLSCVLAAGWGPSLSSL